MADVVAGIAVALAALGLLGIVYSVLGKSDRGRKVGMRLCQISLGFAGGLLTVWGMLSGRAESAVYGSLLLIVGTTITVADKGRKGG